VFNRDAGTTRIAATRSPTELPHVLKTSRKIKALGVTKAARDAGILAAAANCVPPKVLPLATAAVAIPQLPQPTPELS